MYHSGREYRSFFDILRHNFCCGPTFWKRFFSLDERRAVVDELPVRIFWHAHFSNHVVCFFFVRLVRIKDQLKFFFFQKKTV